MNVLNQIMSYDKNQECNCGNCKPIIEEQITEYPPLSEEEIEKIIKERYDYKDEKTKIFIRKALRKHGDKYDYSNSVYVKWDINIEIICRIEGHDSFLMRPDKHCYRGQGCKLCGIKKRANKKRMTLEEFIEKSNEKHGFGRYNYSKVVYVNYNTNVVIICNNHDEPYEFLQTPNNHLHGEGCPICRYIKMAEKQKLTLNEFINRANEIHGIGTYDYSHVKYVDYKTLILIICPKHGEFPQTPNDHLQGHGCYICGIEKHKLTLEEFIERANDFYGIGTYDYSESEYIDSQTLIKIICPKEGHGSFWRIPTNHLRCSGCPKCNKNKGEESIRKFLIEKGIEFEEQKSFEGCKYIRKLKFDFYLPKYNLCIESDGSPHFEPINWSGKYTNEEMKEKFESYQIRDNIKNEYCKKNGITLLRVYNLKAYEEVEKYFQTHKIIKEQEIFNL